MEKKNPRKLISLHSGLQKFFQCSKKSNNWRLNISFLHFFFNFLFFLYVTDNFISDNKKVIVRGKKDIKMFNYQWSLVAIETED